MLTCDDRVETPEGSNVSVVDHSHPLANLLDKAPHLLGYNQVQAKHDAQVVARVGSDPLLVTQEYGKGRSLAWTTDIGPHWCPQEFLDWNGFSPLVAG